MKIETAAGKLINISSVKKYIFCPENIMNCPYLDRSILIFENGIRQHSCSNEKAKDTNIPTVCSIQICPLFKQSNEDK